MDSILQKKKECLMCHTTLNLERHHVFGAARRPISEEYGLTVWLCHEHHTGTAGVHFNKAFMQELKEWAQEVFTAEYGEELFFQRFGKNYMKGDKDEDE